ncbi:MAG: arginine--tRNA ligase [Patescibacteria group bacterium]
MFTKKIKEEIQQEIDQLFDFSVDLEEIELERPTDENHGDLSTNIAFKLAGRVGKNPEEIAKDIASNLSREEFNSKNKKGFINFYFTDSALVKTVKENLKFKEKEVPKTMVLDYSAPNIAKPFGIGHLRSTIVGQAIYNIYDFSGWEAVGVNHLGDWGTQYGKLLYQIIEKDLDPEELSVKDLEKLYVEFHKEAEENSEMEDEARKWFKKLEDGDKRARKIWEKCVEISTEEFDKTYDLLEVDIDHCIGESFYEDKMEAVIEEAKDKGIAKESEGALIIDFDEKMPPAMLLKSDGGTNYFTRDLATVKYRIERWDPDLFIYEIGADQKLHMKQLFETVEMLGWRKKEDFMHVAHGMYRLKSGAMSTRKGKTIHLEDVLKEAIERAENIIEESETTGEMTDEEKRKAAEKIGVGAVKYADLKKHYKKDIVFDWDKVLNLKGNSGPYLQYTTLRAKSVLEKHEGKISFEIKDLSEEERTILKKVSEFRNAVDIAKRNFTPSTIANYSYELAKKFNAFYGNYPILDAKENKMQRLAITKASYKTLKKSLSLLGISLPERM